MRSVCCASVFLFPFLYNITHHRLMSL
jgi:hypothetical protein